MKKEMLINVLQPEECRIAIVEDGVLEELYVERTSQESFVGNIYKGRIVNIEPSIQAAFVDFGIGRNGFLHVSDVEPAYYRHLMDRRDAGNGRGRDRDRGERPERGERGERPDRGERGERGGRGRGRDRGERGGRGRGRDRDRRASQTAAQLEADLEALEREEDAAVARLDPDPLPEATGEVPDAPAVIAAETIAVVQTEVLTPVAEAAPPGGESTTAETEEVPDKKPARRRGGRSRRRKSEETPEAPAEATAEEPKPEPMPSAERRTSEDDETAPPVESSGSSPDDDLLFFPRSTPQATATAPPPRLPVAERHEERYEPPPAEGRAPRHEPIPYREEDHSAEEFDADEKAEEFDDERAGRVEEDRADDFEDDRFEEFDEEDEQRRRRRQRDGGRGGRRGRNSRAGFGRPKPLIQDIFKRGQEVLVQVIKDGIGTKGPTLSTYISIAGRYLVLMPGLNRVGVSRKIADDDQRRRLRDVFNELAPPKGLGFIIRTAGIDKTKKELQNDLNYLTRLWQVVVRRIRKLKSPSEIYQESDMITRTIRDTFTNDIDTIWVDEPAAFEHAQEFMQIVMPRYAGRIKLYGDSEPMFYKYGIEDEIQRIQQRHVPLPHGGSIVIDQTEALVAIDVNSGNFRADNNAEETAYQMNLHAAKEIARQLRLRDLGGVIVNDFIDMREERHRREVERALRDALKRDRARTKTLKMSSFGIIEMTRQRIRPSLKRSVYDACDHCKGTGQVKTWESMSIDVMRLLQLASHKKNVQTVSVTVHEAVANFLQNKKRRDITRLEEAGQILVTIHGVPGVSPESLKFVCMDSNANEVKLLQTDEPRLGRRRP